MLSNVLWHIGFPIRFALFLVVATVAMVVGLLSPLIVAPALKELWDKFVMGREYEG